MTGFNARPFDQIVSPFWPLPNDPVAVSEIALACVSAIQGDLEEADRWQVGAIRRSEEVGFPRGPFSLAFVKTYAAWIQRFLGDHDKARLLGAEVVGIGQSYGYAYWMLLGSSYVAAGRPGGAPERGFLEDTIANIRLLGQEAFVASNLSYLAILSHEDGLVEEALSLVEEALDVVAKTGECLHLPSSSAIVPATPWNWGRPDGDRRRPARGVGRVPTPRGEGGSPAGCVGDRPAP